MRRDKECTRWQAAWKQRTQRRVLASLRKRLDVPPFRSSSNDPGEKCTYLNRAGYEESSIMLINRCIVQYFLPAATAEQSGTFGADWNEDHSDANGIKLIVGTTPHELAQESFER